MAYKKNIFKDRTVITLSAISVIATAALIGGIAMDKQQNKKETPTNKIVDLNEVDTTAANNEVADNEVTTTKPTTTTSEPITEEPTTTDLTVNAPASSLNFTKNSILTWPVDGNIVIDYDMENTVYFPTLELYKCSDALCIQSDIGTPVYASAKCVVEEIGYNEEIGNYIVVDLGNGYLLTYGQLSDIPVNKQDLIEKNDLLGYIATPTDYYSVEGPNLYLKLTENGTPVNPLDYLNYE